MKIAVGIALVWLAMFTMGGVMFRNGAASQSADAAYALRPLTAPAPGDVRLEGTIVDDATVIDISYVTTREVNEKEERSWTALARRQTGAERVGISVGDTQVFLVTQTWKPAYESSQMTSVLPPNLHVSGDEVAAARAKSSDRFAGFGIQEASLKKGERVFIVGRLTDTLELAANEELKKLALRKGSRADFVAKRESSASGLRIASYIFFAIAWLPLLVMALIALRRKP